MKKEYSIEVENLLVNYRSMKSFKIKSNILKIWKKKDVFTALKNINFKIER